MGKNDNKTEEGAKSAVEEVASLLGKGAQQTAQQTAQTASKKEFDDKKAAADKSLADAEVKIVEAKLALAEAKKAQLAAQQTEPMEQAESAEPEAPDTSAVQDPLVEKMEDIGFSKKEKSDNIFEFKSGDKVSISVDINAKTAGVTDITNSEQCLKSIDACSKMGNKIVLGGNAFGELADGVNPKCVAGKKDVIKNFKSTLDSINTHNAAHADRKIEQVEINGHPINLFEKDAEGQNQPRDRAQIETEFKEALTEKADQTMQKSGELTADTAPAASSSNAVEGSVDVRVGGKPADGNGKPKADPAAAADADADADADASKGIESPRLG